MRPKGPDGACMAVRVVSSPPGSCLQADSRRDPFGFCIEFEEVDVQIQAVGIVGVGTGPRIGGTRFPTHRG
jgi:hypothetical protein